MNHGSICFFTARRAADPSRAGQKTKADRLRNRLLWGMVDSNHRRHRQQIYSLVPLATREIPHVLL